MQLADGARPRMDQLVTNRGRGSAGTLWLLALLLVVCGLPLLAGCEGCRKSDDQSQTQEQKKEKKPKKKKPPPFAFGPFETLPSGDAVNRNYAKPGHAATARLGALSREQDVRAEFEAFIADVSGRPVLIPETRYHLVMSRPAALPKGQRRFLESTYFMPTEVKGSGSRFLNYVLRQARGSRPLNEGSLITSTMPAHQYIFAVLSTRPNAFGYIQQLPAIRPPYQPLLDLDEELVFYSVVLPKVDARVPVPSHPFAWTMVAYVLWDGISPTTLTPGQQQAMVDWLHWGGQLIVSGPTSLNQLAGSFLDPYLPATATQAKSLGPEQFAELDAQWSLVDEKSGERRKLTLPDSSPVVGVAWQKRPDAQFVPGTGELVAERRVGRGRVVVTAFPLVQRDLVNWPSWDSFFNTVLLRRPAREYKSDDTGLVKAQWIDSGVQRDSALLSTATRYFTRDIGSDTLRAQ